MKERVQKIWNNHDDVLAFGVKSLNKYLPLLLEKCPYGSETNMANVRMGIEIIGRLGGYTEVDAAIKFISKTINDLESGEIDSWGRKQIFFVRLLTLDHLK